MRTHKQRKYGRYGTWKHAAKAQVVATSGRNGENKHVIVERPGADPRACARVERIKVLVTEMLDSPEAHRIDPTTTSLVVHIAAGWLGETRGYETGWEHFDAKAFLEDLPKFSYFSPPQSARVRDSLCWAFEWMGAHGHLEPAFAERVAREVREGWPTEFKLPDPATLLASMMGLN